MIVNVQVVVATPKHCLILELEDLGKGLPAAIKGEAGFGGDGRPVWIEPIVSYVHQEKDLPEIEDLLIKLGSAFVRKDGSIEVAGT